MLIGTLTYQVLTRKTRLVACLLTTLLVACGGSGAGVEVNGPVSPSNGIGGLAALGAPIAEGEITVYDSNGMLVTQPFATTKLGEWSLVVSKTEVTNHPFPWLIKAAEQGGRMVWTYAHETDIGAHAQSVNANPFTTAVLEMSGVDVGDGTLDAEDIDALSKLTKSRIEKAELELSSVLKGAVNKIAPTISGNAAGMIRTESFWGNGTGLDALLDKIQIHTGADGKIDIYIPALNISVTIDTRTDVPLNQQLSQAKQVIDDAVEAQGNQLTIPPSLVVFESQSSWGEKTNTWAGVIGAISILPTKDFPKAAVFEIKVPDLELISSWGASTSYNKTTQVLTVTMPEWKPLNKGEPYSIGLNLAGSKEAYQKSVKNASGCRIHSEPCATAYAGAKTEDKGTLHPDRYFLSYKGFFEDPAKTKEEVDKANEEAGTKANAAAFPSNNESGSGGTKASSNNSGGLTTTNTGTGNSGAGSNQNASFLVTVSSGGGWSNGFGGLMTVKNTSSAPINNWATKLSVTQDAFSGKPVAWNGIFTYENGIITVKPALWDKQSLNAGETWSSGFNGGFAKPWLIAFPTSDQVTYQPDSSLVSLTNSQSTTTPTTSPPPPPPISTPSTSTTSTTQNWEKDPGTTNATATAANPCNSVRWGKVESVSEGCLTLMDTYQFGGPLHTNGDQQIPLTNGKPNTHALGYWVEWGVYGRKFGVENFPAAQYSKLLFSFVRLNPDGSLMITDEWASLQKDDTGTLLGLKDDPFRKTWENQDRGTMSRLIMLKSRFPHLTTAFSVGGWSLSGQFSSVTADPIKRQKFISSLLAFATKFGFDGIDLDWEYPVVGGNLDTNIPGVSYAEANPGYATDAANFTLFLKELRQAITNGGAATNRDRTKSGKIEVSIAVGTGPKAIDAINYKDIIGDVDTINLMAYDYNGGWSNIVSHNAPLYDNNGRAGPKELGGFDQSEWNEHDAILNILWNLKYQGGKALRADGELGQQRFHKGDNGTSLQSTREALLSDPELAAYRKKLVLGIPFYGRVWSSSATLPAGDITNPWFTGSGGTIGSFEKGVVDSKDLIYARDGKFSAITANGRASTWPPIAIHPADIHWDPKSCTSLVKTSENIANFDDEDAIYHKSKFVKDKGLGGVMVWEVDGDTPDAKLAKSFVRGFKTGSTPPLGKICLHR